MTHSWGVILRGLADINVNKTYINQTKTNCLRTIPKKSLPLLLAFIATFSHCETFPFFTFKWTLSFTKRFILLHIRIYCLNEALEQHHNICLFLFTLGFVCSSKNCVSSLSVTSTNLEGISMFFSHFASIGMNSFNFSLGSKTTNDSKHRAHGPLKTARNC